MGAMANNNAVITVTCFMKFSLCLSCTGGSRNNLLTNNKFHVAQKRNLAGNLNKFCILASVAYVAYLVAVAQNDAITSPIYNAVPFHGPPSTAL